MVKHFKIACGHCGQAVTVTCAYAKYCSRRCKELARSRRNSYDPRQKERQRQKYLRNREKYQAYSREWARRHRIAKPCRVCGIDLPLGQKKYCSHACRIMMKSERQKKPLRLGKCKYCAAVLGPKKHTCIACQRSRFNTYNRNMRIARQASKQVLQELNILPTPQVNQYGLSLTATKKAQRNMRRNFKIDCINEARRLWEKWSKLLDGPTFGPPHPFFRHPIPRVKPCPSFGYGIPLLKYIAGIMALRGMPVHWNSIQIMRQRGWTYHQDAKYEKRKRKYDPIERHREYQRQVERYGAAELQRRKREAHKLAVAAHRAVRAFKQQEQIT